MTIGRSRRITFIEVQRDDDGGAIEMLVEVS
jgi:hypothetical protein